MSPRMTRFVGGALLCALLTALPGRYCVDLDGSINLADLSVSDPAQFEGLARKLGLSLNADPPESFVLPEKLDSLPAVERGLVGPIFVGPIDITPGPIIGPIKKGLHFVNVTGNWSAPQQLCVKVNQGPVDVYFLADTTGSMYSYISSIQSTAAAIHAALTTALTDLRLGVGDYKDFGDVYVYQNSQPIASLTSAAFSAAVGVWAASGGGDWPEANLYGLSQVATLPAVAWRVTSTKAIVWFGDAPGHDPSGGATLSSTIANLQAKGIKVIALDNAMLNNMGQATAIATATGGQYFPSITAANISATIVSAVLNNVVVTVKPIVTCPANTPILIRFEPPTLNVSAVKPGCFNVSVKICADTECFGGRFTCTVSFVDAATNIPIGPTQIIVADVPSTDTTPPVISPTISTPSVIVECPGKFVVPPRTATDNCGDVKLKEKVLSAVGGCPANYTETHIWTATDGSGNTATDTQSVTFQDSQPPFIKPACAAMGPICLGWSSQSGVYCLETKKWASCFGDTCSAIKSVSFDCGTCAGAFGGAMGCRSNQTHVCFKIEKLPTEGPNCCKLKSTATDACGNTASFPFPKVCAFVAGTVPPEGCSSVTYMPPTPTTDPKRITATDLGTVEVGELDGRGGGRRLVR